MSNCYKIKTEALFILLILKNKSNMKANQKSKLNLRKDLKWILKQPNIREKMMDSVALTQFLLSHEVILDIEVTDREATVEEVVTNLFNHSGWVNKKK
jgi:hypothetical protein